MKELAEALEKQRLPTTAQKPGPPPPPQPASSGVEGEADRLCLQAEGLMELSGKMEADGDYYTAMAKCTQAVGESSYYLFFPHLQHSHFCPFETS